MSLTKNYSGYKSFDYLEKGKDYRFFELADELDRIPEYLIPLDEAQVKRLESIVSNHIMISMHEHLGVFPADVHQTPTYLREGRMATGFEGLSNGYWDAVFDNLMNGLCQIHSKSGWKWTEGLHD